MYWRLPSIDLNADVTVVTVPIDTPASWTVCVTEASASHAPTTMNSFSKSLRSFHLVILIRSQNPRGLLSVFIHATERDRMVIASLYHAVHLCGNVCIPSVSTLLYAGFSFNLSPVCIKTSTSLLKHHLYIQLHPIYTSHIHQGLRRLLLKCNRQQTTTYLVKRCHSVSNMTF